MEQKPTQNPCPETKEGGVSNVPDGLDAELLTKLASMDESEILAMACAQGLGGDIRGCSSGVNQAPT